MAFDEEGWCYTGGENGFVQVWGLDAKVERSIKAHAMPVTAITTDGKQLISSSKDGKIALIAIGAGGIFKLEKFIDLSAIHVAQDLPMKHAISVDLFKGNMLIGLRNGTALEIKDIKNN